MRGLLIALMVAQAAGGGTVIDRIAVVAGRHAIKASEIDRDVRVTEFLNHEPLNENAAAKKRSAERLIDQLLIREDLATAGYGRAGDADATAMLLQIRKSAYGDSESRMAAGLRQYGLTEDELRAQLLWQLTVLRFIDQRFRAGVLVTDEEVRAYYDQHRAAFKGEFDAATAATIRSSLEGEQVNRQFEAWLEDSRKQQQVEYREEAFR